MRACVCVCVCVFRHIPGLSPQQMAKANGLDAIAALLAQACELHNWLVENDATMHFGAFFRARYFLDRVAHLTESDLDEVGIKLQGQRLKLMRAAKTIGSTTTTTSVDEDDSARSALDEASSHVPSSTSTRDLQSVFSSSKSPSDSALVARSVSNTNDSARNNNHNAVAAVDATNAAQPAGTLRGAGRTNSDDEREQARVLRRRAPKHSTAIDDSGAADDVDDLTVAPESVELTRALGDGTYRALCSGQYVMRALFRFLFLVDSNTLTHTYIHTQTTVLLPQHGRNQVLDARECNGRSRIRSSAAIVGAFDGARRAARHSSRSKVRTRCRILSYVIDLFFCRFLSYYIKT